MLDNYDSMVEATELGIKKIRDEQDNVMKEFEDTLKKIEDENVMIALKQLFHLTWLEFRAKSQSTTLQYMSESRILAEENDKLYGLGDGQLDKNN